MAYERVSGDTPEEVRQAAWAACDPGRYVTTIHWTEDGEAKELVYREGVGWLVKDFSKLKAA